MSSGNISELFVWLWILNFLFLWLSLNVPELDVLIFKVDEGWCIFSLLQGKSLWLDD